MSADEILFRCHALKDLDTPGKKKGQEFGATAMKTMRKTWLMHEYGRFKEIDNKYTSKGKKNEEDGITLLARVRVYPFRKNTIRLSNDFITGEIDTFIGESVDKAEHTFDIKISWDAETFYAAVDAELNPEYEYQGHGYMDLSGAKKHTVAYCLINTNIDDVRHELYKENFKWEDNNAPAWVRLQLLTNMVYDKKTFDKYINDLDIFIDQDDEKALAIYNGFIEIPMIERLHEKTFDRDEVRINAIHNRVVACRKKMNELFYSPSIMLAEHDKELNAIIVEQA